MKNTTVIVKEGFAKNVLEFLTGTHFNYLFTEPKTFGGESIVIFVLQGEEEDVEFFERWINGAFSTYSAMVCPFHFDSENKPGDLFIE